MVTKLTTTHLIKFLASWGISWILKIRVNAPANFTTLKHMASNLLRRAPGKDSLHVKRRGAARHEDFLASLIAR